MKYTVELAVDSRCSLGEGPIWDASGGRVMWIDYYEATLHEYSPAEGMHSVHKLADRVASFALREEGGLIVAGDRGLAYYDPTNSQMSYICDPENHQPHTRFNDGKCDPKGRFIAGTASEDDEPKGALYVFYPDGSYKQLDRGIGCSNGITWSKDEKTMYYIDSLAYCVNAFEYDMKNGMVSNKRSVISYQGKDVLPDGMTSDEEGMIWVAEWGGWRVTRWNPQTGERLSSVDLPVKYVTSCVFGGKNWDELYITTAASPLKDSEKKEQPEAGGLFRAKIGIPGRPTYLFKG